MAPEVGEGETSGEGAEAEVTQGARLILAAALLAFLIFVVVGRWL